MIFFDILRFTFFIWSHSPVNQHNLTLGNLDTVNSARMNTTTAVKNTVLHFFLASLGRWVCPQIIATFFSVNPLSKIQFNLMTFLHDFLKDLRDYEIQVYAKISKNIVKKAWISAIIYH